MTPLLVFLLGLAAIYVGTVATAFSALMKLSLRLRAERSGRDDLLGLYLDEPLRLFIPARLLLVLIPVAAAGLLARVTGVDFARGLPLLLVSTLVFALVCEHILPLLIIRRDPERVLDLLLPSFHAGARVLAPVTLALTRVGVRRDDGAPGPVNGEAEPVLAEAEGQTAADGPVEELQDRQARTLLRSLIDFRDTMVREVMTPRPDIVAISSDATLEDVRALFREQQYSRIPVYKETLDEIQGFVFVKDLMQLDPANPSQSIAGLIRPAHFVPETKRVPELLKELQLVRAQSAIVVDEYGGTAGIVTIEDILEEIVGEIRDEYDVETEPVVDEGDGRFVFSGKVHVEEITERLGVSIEGEGFETVGGYLLAHLGRVPAVGETFEVDGLAVDVLEAERRRITRVRMRRREAPAETADASR